MPPTKLADLLSQARAGIAVVAGLYSSDSCPWCVALKNEQLSPRIKSKQAPNLLIVEFNADSRVTFNFPAQGRKTAKQWAQSQGYRLMPTLVMLNERALPLGDPLVGYSSPDFYAAYLEERIKAAHTYWQTIAS